MGSGIPPCKNSNKPQLQPGRLSSFLAKRLGGKTWKNFEVHLWLFQSSTVLAMVSRDMIEQSSQGEGERVALVVLVMTMLPPLLLMMMMVIMVMMKVILTMMTTTTTTSTMMMTMQLQLRPMTIMPTIESLFYPPMQLMAPKQAMPLRLPAVPLLQETSAAQGRTPRALPTS